MTLNRTLTTRIAAVALLAIALACTAFAGLAQAKARGSLVNVMTRNLYLGADLTPAIESKSTSEFIEANGGIYRQVEATNFPVRAKGLAKEILQNEARPGRPPRGRAVADRAALAAARSSRASRKRPRSSTTSSSCCWPS